MSVTYKMIDGFPAYRVGDDGSVWSRWLRIGLGDGGGTRMVIGDEWFRMETKPSSKYQKVGLRHGGKVKYFSVHVLVATAFIGPCPEGMECAHKDGDKMNCRADNLEWKTHVDNERDKVGHGTLLMGEQHGKSKLGEADVLQIVKMVDSGMTMTEVASLKSVSRPTVGHIMSGRLWSHLTGFKKPHHTETKR